MNELISVIVPVYNVEKFFDACIKSILSQSYSNIEIILVDDGSTDSSGALCNEYAKSDSRIRVIHQKNQGLSGARNTGMSVAKGDYFCFVDSDDGMHRDFIKILYNCLKENESDIAVCNYVKFSGDMPADNDLVTDTYAVWSDIEAINEMCITGRLIPVVWNKIYKRELFENISFPVGKIHEDEFVTPQIIAKITSLPICDAELYYYRQRDDSITGSKNRRDIRHLVTIKAYENKCRIFKGAKYKDVYLEVVRSCLYMIALNYFNLEKEMKFYRFARFFCRIRCGFDVLRFGVKVPSFVYKRYIVFVISPEWFRKRYKCV